MYVSYMKIHNIYIIYIHTYIHTYVYDDNIIHPDLYNLLNYIDNNTLYSFNQYNRIKGNNINIGYIDTAMVLIPFNLCKSIKWMGNFQLIQFYNYSNYYESSCKIYHTNN